MIHYNATYGNCNVPRTMIYECDLPVDEIGQASIDKTYTLIAQTVCLGNYGFPILPTAAAATGPYHHHHPSTAAAVATHHSQQSHSQQSRQSHSPPQAPLTAGLGYGLGPIGREVATGRYSHHSQDRYASLMSLSMMEIPMTTFRYKFRLGRWLDEQRKGRFISIEIHNDLEICKHCSCFNIVIQQAIHE